MHTLSSPDDIGSNADENTARAGLACVQGGWGENTTSSGTETRFRAEGGCFCRRKPRRLASAKAPTAAHMLTSALELRRLLPCWTARWHPHIILPASRAQDHQHYFQAGLRSLAAECFLACC